MDRVLYTKYNSLRRPEYRLTTEINDGDQGKWVEKRAAGPAAETQLDRIMASRELALRLYRDIRVIDAKREKGRIVFPFISGRSLADRIETDALDRDRFVRQVNELFDLVLDAKEACVCSFEPTEAFKAVFGDKYPENARALCPANIDSIFSNFIETEDGLVCIDYEWVFDFPVPTDFIRYRVLFHLYNEWEKSLFDGITREELMGWFGISEEDQKTFWSMESAFQQTVHGKKWAYHYLGRYNKKVISVAQMDEEINGQKELIREKDQHIDNISRKVESLEETMREKDVHIANREQQIETLEETMREKDAHIANRERQIETLEGSVHDKDVHIRNIEQINRDREAQIADLQHKYDEISNAFFWRITAPARKLLIHTRTAVQKSGRLYFGLRCVKAGLRRGPEGIRELMNEREKGKIPPGWPTKEEARQQRETRFSRNIRFSILVPLYNTPVEYLTAMIQSVQAQTYRNWELCLADGSDAEHGEVRKICRKFARRDRRIKYQKLDQNRGISENTNACIAVATGDYIGLFDHDDLLHPSALFEDMKAICEQDADFIYTDENTFHETPADAYWPHYKPDYAPDTLRSYNYICHFTVFARSLLDQTGPFRKEFDGSQDYDLILRLTEKAKHIVHIPRVLYYWRSHANSTASDISAKPYTMTAARKALAEHLERVGLKGEVSDSTIPSTYRIRYEIEGEPLVSIVIPTMDHVDDLRKCVESIRDRSTWKRWEIIIVENNSKEQETFDYYNELKDDSRIRVVTWEKGFNFSGICNLGAARAKGDYILLLNNDMEVITPDWLEQMLMFAQRDDVGAVGAMLYYPDDTIQHAGVILGIGGVGGHSHKYFKRGDYGYASRLTIAQNLSAVTAACILMPRRVWEEVGGLDEGYAVAFNDVDLCMRIREAGYLIIWTPYAELYHYESKSRGYEDSPEKQMRFKSEIDRFLARWQGELDAGDPYYNPNLTLDHEDFSFRDPEGQ